MGHGDMTFALEVGALRQPIDDPTIGGDPPFRQVIRLLRRRHRLILVVAVSGALLAGIGGLLIPPRYTAKAEIVTEAQAPIPVLGDESAVQTHLAALTSPGHLQRVLDSLAHDRPLTQRLNVPGGPGQISDEARRMLTAWLTTAWSTISRPVLNMLPADAPANGPPEARARGPSEPSIEAFERHLLVYQERGSHVLAVTYTSTSPQEAARAANRVAQLYVDGLYDQKRENTHRTLAWIDKRIPEVKAEVERAEAAAQSYRTEHGLASGNQTDVVDQQLADLNHRVTAAEATLAERQARVASLQQLQHGGGAIGTLVQAGGSAILGDLRSREVALAQSKAELTATLGEMHPRTQAVLAQLQEVRGKISRELGRTAGDLRAEVQTATLELNSLQAQLATAQHTSSEARGDEVHLRDLERGETTIRQVYENLLQRREQLTEQQEMISPDVRILSLATPPDRPSSANPFLFALPALVVFLVGGGLAAVASDRLDQGLRSARDVSESLGIPCIALVPWICRTRKMRPHQHLRAKPFGPYTEAIRSVAASLQLAAPRGLPQAILVSSSVPQEGKTTLAVSLAVYAAMLGRRVILVDLDFRHPAIWREIGGKSDIGLPDRLDGDRLSVAAIRSVSGLGLDVLPVRRRPDDPLLPFVDGELPRLLGQLRGRYDCIVVDGPPLLAVTEARLLAGFVDKVLFLVKWGHTRKDMAQNALRLLRDTRVPGSGDMIMGVVTQVDMNKHAQYRYGDVGESFVRYAPYYLKGPDAVPPGNALCPLPLSGGDGQFRQGPSRRGDA